jgi:hypothetical protein
VGRCSFPTSVADWGLEVRGSVVEVGVDTTVTEDTEAGVMVLTGVSASRGT